MHPFEKILSVSIQDIEFELRGVTQIEWSEFLLNPRRLRGSDFLMRWSQGHILPYVKFEGGELKLVEDCLTILKNATK